MGLCVCQNPAASLTTSPGQCHVLGMALHCILLPLPTPGSCTPPGAVGSPSSAIPQPDPSPGTTALAALSFCPPPSRHHTTLLASVIIFYLKQSLFSHFIFFLLLAMYRLLQSISTHRYAPHLGLCMAQVLASEDVWREARWEAGPNSTKQIMLRQQSPPPRAMLHCSSPLPWGTCLCNHPQGARGSRAVLHLGWGGHYGHPGC